MQDGPAEYFDSTRVEIAPVVSRARMAPRLETARAAGEACMCLDKENMVTKNRHAERVMCEDIAL